MWTAMMLSMMLASPVLVLAGTCTEQQLQQGCAWDFCQNETACECIPNYVKVNGICERDTKPHKMTFYMYRAMDYQNYPSYANDDFANIPGVMWYLHNEAVGESGCPIPKFNISRVIRLKVTVFNTQASFNERHSQLYHVANFDKGAAAGTQNSIFDQKGYVVGCETPGGSSGYAIPGWKQWWASLPGPCPEKQFGQKTADCESKYPGGQCSNPDGTDRCTWTYEEAGEVTLSELVGITDWDAFCKKGCKMYDRRTDKGTCGMSFWDGLQSTTACLSRMQKLIQLFQSKYPNSASLPDALCDYTERPGTDAMGVIVV